MEMWRYWQADRNNRDFEFDIPLSNLSDGDDPIYIRVKREDGHVAWTARVDLVNKSCKRAGDFGRIGPYE